MGFHAATGLRAVLFDRCRDGERNVPDALLPLAILLPDALRDDSDHGVGLVVWEERENECRVGAESEADDGSGARLSGAMRAAVKGKMWECEK